MSTRVGEVALANPVMTASGTAGHGAELGSYLDLGSLGAVVVKSLSAEAWAGNPAPRLHPAGAGMLNSVGLQNPGVDTWLRSDLPALAAAGATVVASIWGFSVDAYFEAARALAGGLAASSATQASSPLAHGTSPVVAVEVNISCPNVEDRRRMFAHSFAGAAAAVGAAVDGLAGSGLPVWAKLSPNVTDLPAIAGAVIEAGAGALTLVNTMMALALDPASGRPRLGGGGGGLSGQPLHPVAVRAIYDCRAAWPDVPIVGVGGVASGADAAEMMAAGAQAVQVGTATFVDPRAPVSVLAGLERWCRRHQVSAVTELIGRAHDP